MFEVGDLVEPDPACDQEYLGTRLPSHVSWPQPIVTTNVDSELVGFEFDLAPYWIAERFRKVEAPASNCSREVCADHNDYSVLVDGKPNKEYIAVSSAGKDELIRRYENENAQLRDSLAKAHELQQATVSELEGLKKSYATARDWEERAKEELFELKQLQQATMADCERLSQTAERDKLQEFGNRDFKRRIEQQRKISQFENTVAEQDEREQQLLNYIEQWREKCEAIQEDAQITIANRERMIADISEETTAEHDRAEKLEKELAERTEEVKEFERRWEEMQKVAIQAEKNADRFHELMEAVADERNQLKEELDKSNLKLKEWEEKTELWWHWYGKYQDVLRERNDNKAEAERLGISLDGVLGERDMADALVKDLYQEIETRDKEIADKNAHIGQLTQRLLEVSGDAVVDAHIVEHSYPLSVDGVLISVDFITDGSIRWTES